MKNEQRDTYDAEEMGWALTSLVKSTLQQQHITRDLTAAVVGAGEAFGAGCGVSGCKAG